MDCPNCGGPTFDNRQKVQGGWRGPLFKCKDRDGCGWVKWPPKNQQNQQRSGSTNNGRSAPKDSRPLGPLYFKCMQIAKASLDKFAPASDFTANPKGTVRYTAADLAAATATLLIAATNTGAPLVDPPKPKPKPEPSYDDTMGDMQGEPDEMPF